MENLTPTYKSYYTGEMDAWHEGPCCGGCTGEQELGYSGGGEHCCCYEGLTPLEQWTYDPKYPPIGGKIPKEFWFFGNNTQHRWIQRFEKELLPEELEKYHKWR